MHVSNNQLIGIGSAIIVVLIVGVVFFMLNTSERGGVHDVFNRSSGEGRSNVDSSAEASVEERNGAQTNGRDVFEPIPDSEILSGGPGKDGIPSIDDPVFISHTEATFLEDDDPGIGLEVNGIARFYPFEILVWHEIVNDTVASIPLAVTYCPLCLTGVTYERRLNGETIEFGVSGKLWKSNLLMYNRADDLADESLWSQVLGRAVQGPHTGTRLTIYPSDTVRFSDWVAAHPGTEVLSRSTGALRPYGVDPYGDYYTNRDVSFGATFDDDRLHPKEYVLGVEHNGNTKAYVADALPVGTTRDTFAGAAIRIEKTQTGTVRMFADDEPLPLIGGFWFSWLAVHPDTELWGAS